MKIICKKAGYEDFSKDVKVTDQPIEENIVLKPVPVAKFKTTVQFRNQKQQAVTKTFTLLDKQTNKPVTVEKGVMVLTEEPKKTFKYVVQDASFDDTEFEITTIDKDQTIPVPLIELDFFRIQLVGQPGKYVPSLLNSINVIAPDMELDKSKLAEGFFITKKREDITLQAKVTVVYNQKTATQEISAGPDENKVIIDTTTPETEKQLSLVVGILYPQDGNFDRLKNVTVNGTVVATANGYREERYQDEG